MTPEQKADISRINGAKSRGPVTAAGRARSSRNATRHGFTSNHMVLLNCENPTEFQRVLDEYLLMYRPSSAIERSLVNEMVAAHWRIRRLWTIETALFNLELFQFMVAPAFSAWRTTPAPWPCANVTKAASIACTAAPGRSSVSCGNPLRKKSTKRTRF
jgi:hypothetical protein